MLQSIAAKTTKNMCVCVCVYTHIYSLKFWSVLHTAKLASDKYMKTTGKKSYYFSTGGFVSKENLEL